MASGARVLLVLLVLLACSVSAFQGSPAHFWWLNTFLGNQTIGRFKNPPGAGYIGIGPCPDQNPGCRLKFANLSQSIKEVGVSLPAPFGTNTIGSLFPTGYLKIYMLEVNDLELNDVVIAGSSNVTSQNMTVVVKGFKANVGLGLLFAELTVPLSPVKANLELYATTNKSVQTVGTDVRLEIFFNAPPGKTLANSFASSVTLGKCSIDLDLALTLQLINNAIPFQNAASDIANFVYTLLEPFVGDLVCGAIRQFFTTTASGTDGFIKVQVDRVFSAIGNLSSLADPVIATEEAIMVSGLTAAQKANSITFAENRIVEGASKVVNNWLGASASNPLVNEVVNLLTMPDNGTATFTNLTRFGLSIPIVTPIVKVTVDVHNATLGGLNTFGLPNGFQLIKNNYDNALPRLNYTLDNRFSLSSLSVHLVADVKLERNFGYDQDAIPGGWIFNRAPLGLAQTSFRLDYTLSLSQLNLSAALSLAMDPTQLGTLQLGQLLGKSGNATTAAAQAILGGKCSAPAMYGFTLPFFELGLGAINTPVFAMTPSDAGIVALVNSVTDIVLNVLESPLTQDIDKISLHWIRPLVNEIVRDTFVAGGAATECPEYISAGKFTPNFQTSAIFSSVKQLIRDVIGGNPVKSNTVSINELLQQVLLFACEAFGSASTCSTTGQGKWRLTPPLSFYPGESFPVSAPFDSVISVTGVDVNGVNSVSKLIIDNVAGFPQGIALLLELGTLTNPLQIVLKNHWMVNYATPFTKSDVDELFNLTIAIQGLKVNATIKPDFDLNQLYLLTVDDLFHSACVLAPFASLDVDLGLSMTAISVLVSNSSGPHSVAGNDLRTSLGLVVTEQGSGYPNLKNMVDYVLRSVTRFVAKTADGVSNAVINATNCRDERNLFDTFVVRILKSALTANLTDVIGKATGPQPAVPAAEVLDAQVTQPFGSSPFDLQESFFVPLINDAISRVQQESVTTLLQTLGNGTGDILSDSFVTETDGSVSLDIDFMNYTTFKDGFNLDFLIENATFFIYRARLTNMTNIDMSTIKVAKPVSKFVTETYISIPNRMSLLLSFGIKLPQALKGVTGPDVLTNIDFSMDLVDLEIALQTLTALDQKRVNGLSLGHFVTVDANQTFGLNTDAINCLIRLFLPGGLSLPQLQIGLSSIGSPTINASRHDFVSHGTLETIQTMFRILGDFYVKDLKDVTQGGLRPLINKFLLEPNLENPGPCRDPAPPNLPASARILNFQNSSTISFLHEFTRDLLAGKDGKYTLFNTVLNAALDDNRFFRSPDNQLGFTDLKVVYKKQIFGMISAYIRDVGLEGLGSFTKLNLLDARSNVMLNNNISFAGPFDFTFGLKWLLTNLWAIDDGTGITDEIQFTLQMHNVTLGLTLSMEIDIPDLLVIQAGSFNNISQIACVLTAFRSFKINKFVFDVDKIKTTLECAGVCESPLFEGIASGVPVTSGDSGNSVANYIPQIIELIVNYLNSNTFASSAQDTIDNAAESCIQALNLTTAIAILNPEKHHNTNVAVIFGLGLLGIGAALFVLAPLTVPRHYQLKDKMLAANLLQANSEPNANAQSVARYMAKAERSQVALAWHPAVNKCCKCFVPLMAIANVVLLALSFLVYLAFSVEVRLFLLGSETKTYTMVPWTVSSTINDMWNSGAWPLSVLIVFASCAWPVIKNIALFFIWFAPKTFISHHNRHWYLVQLDILGKWSFLDVYIIVLLVGILKFTLVLANAPALEVLPIPAALAVVDLVVTPGTGIVLLSIAAFMSLVVNHIIIWELHKAEWADNRLFKQIDGEQDDYLTPKANIRLAISEYVFSTTAPNGQRDRYGPKAKNQLILLMISAVVFLIIGDFLPYFSVTYDGLVGITLAFFIQGGRKRTFSLMYIGTTLPAASIGTPYSNVLFLFFTILYYATVIIAPIAQIGLHLFLWLRPLSVKDANTVMFWAKVCAYWASIEVFCVAIIATTIEVKPVTYFLFDFITGGTCGALIGPLTDFLGSRDGSCLTPAAFVEWGFFISFASNLYQIAVGAIMIRASGVAIRDREDILERRPHQQWTNLEYLILDKLLVHGAKHHKPPPQPEKASLASRFAVDCQSNPLDACCKCGSNACSKINCCGGCFSGVQDVSLSTPANHGGRVANSKWNAPPSSSAAPSNRWNAPSQAYGTPSQAYGAPASASPSWNMSQTQSQMVVNQPLETSNPIFAREQQKRYSVDV